MNAARAVAFVAVLAARAIMAQGTTAAAPHVTEPSARADCTADTLTVGFPERWIGTTIGQVTVDAHTVEAPPGFLGDVVHALHFTTRLRVPLNNITFQAGQPMDSLEVLESVRRLRRANVYSDVHLVGTRCAGSSVTDLRITTRDSWSLRGDIRYGRIASRVSFSELNLLGGGRTLAVTAENVDDRNAITIALTEPYFFNPRLRAGLQLRNYGDGRSWNWTVRSRDFSPRDPWRFTFTSSQLLRQQLDVTQPVALAIERRNDQLSVQRLLSQSNDGVLALVFGLEHEKSDLDVVRLGARLGRPQVQREFTAPILGLARRGMRVGSVDWLVPGQLRAEVPIGFDGEFVVGAGEDHQNDNMPIGHFDSWGGYTWQPSPGTLLTSDLWLSGYVENDSLADGVARLSAAIYQRAPRGQWALRLAVERVMNPDPDVFALSTVDPTLRALAPSSRLAESALTATLERSIATYVKDRIWAVEAVPFLQYTERHRSVATSDTTVTNPEAFLVGLGIRRVWGQPTQAPIRFDVSHTVWTRNVQPRWVFTLSTQPWFSPGRRREGARDVNAR